MDLWCCCHLLSLRRLFVKFIEKFSQKEIEKNKKIVHDLRLIVQNVRPSFYRHVYIASPNLSIVFRAVMRLLSCSLSVFLYSFDASNAPIFNRCFAKFILCIKWTPYIQKDAWCYLEKNIFSGALRWHDGGDGDDDDDGVKRSYSHMTDTMHLHLHSSAHRLLHDLMESTR